MKELDGLLSSLQYDNCSTFNDSILEFIYCGAIRKHPIKVMNPNPNIDYTGWQLQVIGENGKYTFSELIEKDYIKANRRLESSHIGFDIRDIYSPNNENKKQGRFSFQFEDMSMSNGAPNYRRILFFFALDTNPKRFKDYFKGAKEFELEDQGLYVLTFLNEEGVPSGFAYIYDRRLNVYYFANFRNGKLHGFFSRSE